MNAILVFWIVFLCLLALFVYLDIKCELLRDQSAVNKKNRTRSFARTQLAWWSLIILSSIISIMICHNAIPQLTYSTLVLLGISAATTASARITDISDIKQDDITYRHQDNKSKGILVDLITNQNGASIHRLQALIFNLAFGIWMIVNVVNNLNNGVACSNIIPDFGNNELILFGISSGTYAVLKVPENKVAQGKT
jgi:hypothetical protein